MEISLLQTIPCEGCKLRCHTVTTRLRFQMALYWTAKCDPQNYRPSYIYTVCDILERLIHKQLVCYFDEHDLLFVLQSDSRRKTSTRHNSRLLLLRVKSNFGKNTSLFSGANIFNELPADITKVYDIQSFCHRAKGFLLSQQFLVVLLEFQYCNQIFKVVDGYQPLS